MILQDIMETHIMTNLAIWCELNQNWRNNMIKKYKAFLKDEKRTVDVDVIFFETEVVKVTDNNFYQFEDIILMQSTGLHDSTKFEDLSVEEQEDWLGSGKSADEWQGRWIFEGDIVEIIYDREPFIGVVVYDLGETDFKATNGNEDYSNNFQYLTVGESIEVIGNIYQNQELLGE